LRSARLGRVRTLGLSLSSPGVERTTVLWTLVVFFGASVLFGVISNLTEDESTGLRVGLEAVAGLALIGLLVVIVRGTRE
jgi:hypothetical protein